MDHSDEKGLYRLLLEVSSRHTLGHCRRWDYDLKASIASEEAQCRARPPHGLTSSSASASCASSSLSVQILLLYFLLSLFLHLLLLLVLAFLLSRSNLKNLRPILSTWSILPHQLQILLLCPFVLHRPSFNQLLPACIQKPEHSDLQLPQLQQHQENLPQLKKPRHSQSQPEEEKLQAKDKEFTSRSKASQELEEDWGRSSSVLAGEPHPDFVTYNRQ